MAKSEEDFLLITCTLLKIVNLVEHYIINKNRGDTPLFCKLFIILETVMSYPQGQIKLMGDSITYLLYVCQGNIYYQTF